MRSNSISATMNDLRSALPAVLALSLAACSSGSRATHGAVAGDVYVALETGENVSAGAAPVHLIAESAELDSVLAAICAQRQKELAGLGAAPESLQARLPELRQAASERAWEARGRVLTSRSRGSTVTGADARFAIDSVAAGEYRVWADAVLNGERWTWLEPIEVRGGDTVRVSLGNDNADDDPFNCQKLPVGS